MSIEFGVSHSLSRSSWSIWLVAAAGRTRSVRIDSGCRTSVAGSRSDRSRWRLSAALMWRRTSTPSPAATGPADDRHAVNAPRWSS